MEFYSAGRSNSQVMLSVGNQKTANYRKNLSASKDCQRPT